jgi:hypothetical protein
LTGEEINFTFIVCKNCIVAGAVPEYNAVARFFASRATIRALLSS